MKCKLTVTIDGPAASGKSTAARLLAQRLGADFLDTGAMYRAVTAAAMRAGTDITNECKLLELVENTEFVFSFRDNKMSVFVDGLDVTEQIRSGEVTVNVGHIASMTKLRNKLVDMQREFARGRDRIVTEGRDQGTVVFPEADVKFFLTADVTERARRRYAELLAKGSQEDIEQIQQAIEKRDVSDRNRASGPLKPSDDAIVIDTTNLTIDEVVEKLLYWLKEECPGIEQE